MKKKYSILSICVLLSYFLPAQTGYNIKFDTKKLSISSEQAEDNNIYQIIRYGGLMNYADPGLPDIPVKYIKLLVPAEASGFNVVIEKFQQKEISIENYIFPGQHQVPLSAIQNVPDFTEPDMNIYGSHTIYPQNQVEIIHEGFLDGDKHIVTLAIYPVRYNPVLNKLDFVTDLEVTLHYSTASAHSVNTNGIKPLYRKNQQTTDLIFIKQLVDNPRDVEEITSKNNSLRAVSFSVQSTNLPFYEYCIITTRELRQTFERLAAWKRSKGLTAGVVCIEDILSDSGITGDQVYISTALQLKDDAAKIRGYLQQAYQFGAAKYVLFGGNDQLLPIRYGTGMDNNWDFYDASSSYANASKIPTDLYFSDLTGNWNVDGDQYLGERIGDNIDYNPELYVGRILCNNPKEAENYITKLLKYELNPGNGDFSYLKKSFHTQSDQLQANRNAQIISDDFGNIFSTNTIFEEYPSSIHLNPTFPTSKEVIEELNNMYGFIGLYGHGAPHSTLVISSGTNGGDGMTTIRQGIISYENAVTNRGEKNGMDNILNYNYPAICHSSACENTPFDKYKRSGNITHNLGESFTSRGLYGGPAFLGNTRNGWVSTSFSLQRELTKYIRNGYYKLGEAEALSKASYNLSSPGSYPHFLALTHNLIGCPEFEMWTDIPSYYNNVNITTASNAVIVRPGRSATINVTGIFGGISYNQQSISSTKTFTGLPQNYVIMINDHNYIPYFAPLYVQNESITGTHYIHGSDMYFGKNVSSNKTQGELIIKSGSKVTIEPQGIVNLEKGFQVEKGAVFEVRK